MATRDTPIVGRPTSESESATLSSSPGVETATILSLDADGTPTVKLTGEPHVALARWAVKTTRDQVEAAITARQPVVLVFEAGDRTRPLIIGFVETLGAGATAPADVSVGTARGLAIEADVDGRRVKMTAQDEIVLECGNASLTLRRNGRVIIRGTYVESHSEGTNRIKGGQVQIN